MFVKYILMGVNMKKLMSVLMCMAMVLAWLPQCAVTVQADSVIDSLVRIAARPEFAFRYDLSNSEDGEASAITSDYYLSAYKVTNEAYYAFTQATGHKTPKYWTNGIYPEGKADHPVLNVSYSDAISYCQWLNQQYTDWNFRLPTEAEWENAAMGSYYGDTSVKYPHGAASPSYNATTGVLTSSFNYNGVIAAKLFQEYGSDYVVNYIKGDYTGTSETLGECISISSTGGVSNWANHGSAATKGYFLQTDLYATISADGGYTTPVGTYPANSLGLYDMAGNCWDLTSSLITAENGLEAGVTCYAVRGGSWYATSRSCTFYYRGEGRKDSPSATVGFRLAADYIGAEEPKSFTQCSMETTQLSTFRYWLYTPENPTDNMPLIVYLHGGSGKGSDLTLITAVDGFPKYLQDGDLGNLRAYVLIPQLPSDQTGWTSVGASLMQLINQTVSSYSIDENNISLTGHSMGGTGTWAVAAAYPSTFARIAPLSGSIKNTTLNVNKLKNVPVWAMVGSADTVVDPAASENFVEALQTAGGNAQLTVFDGATHFDVPEKAYLNDSALLNWLIDARFAACNGEGVLASCASLEDAAGLGDYVKLLKDAETEVTLEKDLYIDLNGCDLTGTVDTNGFDIYGMDSVTDKYSSDGMGLFLCVSGDGATVEPLLHHKSDITGTVKRYMTVQTEEGFSFHRFYLGITHMTLRPTVSGVGYKAVFYGDDLVQSMVNSFGYSLCLEGGKTVEATMPGTEFESGKTVTLRIDQFDAQNYGETNLHASAKLQLQDGTVIESTTCTMTLRGLMEQLNNVSLTDQQREAIAQMIEAQPIIKTWDVENLVL